MSEQRTEVDEGRGPNTPQYVAKAISRSLVLQHLRDPEGEEDDHGQELSPSDDTNENAQMIDTSTTDTNFVDLQAWLNLECVKEQARASSLEWNNGEQTYTDLLAELSPNFTVSSRKLPEHKQQGEETLGFVPYDLVAPLRLGVPRQRHEESFAEILKVLLAWNEHVLGDCTEDLVARQQLLHALTARLKAADTVLDIAKDKTKSNMYDEVGQEAILEPSKRNLTKAMHAYRPETTSFQDQDPFNLLVMLWANIGTANPDIRDDDELQDLTLKVLAAEAQLVLRSPNAEIKWSIEESKHQARHRRDIAEVVRCMEQIKNFDREVTNASFSKAVNGIARARGELKKAVLEEMLELRVLQAALKWSAPNSMLRAPASAWSTFRERCEEVDVLYERAGRNYYEDLEAAVDIHNSTLTRAIKIAGEVLDKIDGVTRERIIAGGNSVSVTALTMSETLGGIQELQRAVGEMLKHVGAMELPVHELVSVVEGQRRVYAEFASLLSLE